MKDIRKLKIDTSRLNYSDDYYLPLPLKPDMKNEPKKGRQELYPSLTVWFCPVCAHLIFPVMAMSTGRDGRA